MWNKPIAKTILLAFCVFTLLPAQDGPLVAGEGEKKVITSGYGKNPDDALTQALRNAVEEAVGTYMTSTTRIENDELIEDKILSLSRGFIKDFKKLSEMKVDGETKVTVSVIVTKTQILETLKASGIKVKVAGKKMFQQFASFDRQMEDEYKVISSLLKDLPKEGPLDYTVEVSGEPIREQSRGQKKYRIDVKVTGNINQNYKNFYENFRNILVETAFDQKKIKVRSDDKKKNPLFGLFNNVNDNSKARKLKKTITKNEYLNIKSMYKIPFVTGGDTIYYDYFDKPYSPHIISLWTNYNNRYGDDSFDGDVELYKYLNAESQTELAKYIHDYFYDIGFQISAISDQVYKKNFRMTGGDKDFVITNPTDYTFVAKVKGKDYGQRTLDAYHRWNRNTHLSGSSTSAFTDGRVRFASIIHHGFKSERTTPVINPDANPVHVGGRFRPAAYGYGYWLTVLPAPNVYYINWQTEKNTRKSEGITKKGSSLFFETDITILLSEEVFANLESIEIEPLPVRKDF